MKKPPTVTVHPSGIQFPAEPGQTIMAAGLAAGYRWPTICGGLGDCQICYIEVLTHPEHLADPTLGERSAIHAMTDTCRTRGGKLIRLACQAVVEGDVAILKRGVRGSGHPPTQNGYQS